MKPEEFREGLVKAIQVGNRNYLSFCGQPEVIADAVIAFLETTALFIPDGKRRGVLDLKPLADWLKDSVGSGAKHERRDKMKPEEFREGLKQTIIDEENKRKVEWKNGHVTVLYQPDIPKAVVAFLETTALRMTVAEIYSGVKKTSTFETISLSDWLKDSVGPSAKHERIRY